jgi:hypothetical protein
VATGYYLALLVDPPRSLYSLEIPVINPMYFK